MNNIWLFCHTPFWMWPTLIFANKYYKQFNYDIRNEVGKWEIIVYVNYSLGSFAKRTFTVEGKYVDAYIKARLEAVAVDFSYPSTPDIGVSYTIKKLKEDK